MDVHADSSALTKHAIHSVNEVLHLVRRWFKSFAPKLSPAPSLPNFAPVAMMRTCLISDASG